ncbi:MAG TPA: tyrosinase family protein [Pyrinomonadaceae bacterium]|jgi:hypothetical protein
MEDKELQDKVDNILSGQGKSQQRAGVSSADAAADLAEPAQPRPLFSAFVDQHVTRASELSTHFTQVAATQGLEAAVQAIDNALQQEPVVGLVQYALKLFLTHYPEARGRLKLRPLEVRQPNLVRPSELSPAAPELSAMDEALPAGAKGSARKRKKKAAAGATPPENKISFWREDPLLNEHHEHWHLVYPTRPLTPPPGPRPDGGYNLGDRHGELFAYMHEQMLARYDAERIAEGLDPVEPFDVKPLTVKGLSAPIPEGYDPGLLQLWDGSQWYQFRARPADATISDLTLDETPEGGPNWATRPGAKLSDQVKFGNELFAATEGGNYDLIGPGTPVTIDNLGNTVEANANSADFYSPGNPLNFKLYGNLHNDGHIHLMLFDNTAPYGVMATTATAVRDPAFFRWHKLVDDIYYQYQQARLDPYDFSGGPAVKIRKTTRPNGTATSKDIILCLEEGLPASIAGHKFGSRAYNNLAAAAFAYSDHPKRNAWDQTFSTGRCRLPSGETITTTDTLKTQMLEREINVVGPDGNPLPETVKYLSHSDFYYFIRIENMKAEQQTVAVRVFLAPETDVENRRAWIELDRFSYRLKPSERAVIFRPADQSSVVRKPALRPDDLTADDGTSPNREAQAWCDCGWPYTLLLPRGTEEGMKFRLLVMCSSGDDLIIPDHPECCTSISYCGLQDLQYPDKTGMGYPFDRRFKETVTETVHDNDNWAWRTIKIRCKNIR